MKNKKKILITGADGFIGRNICNFFKKKKIKYKKLENNKILSNHASFTHLLHLEFYIGKNNKTSYEKKNLNIIKKIITKCIKQNIKLIFFSTCGADLNINDYTRSKKLCENEIIKYNKKSNLNSIILRIFNVYSSSLNSRGVIPDLIKKMGKKAKIFIDYANNVRDFIYISDFLELINKSLNFNKSIYIQVGTGKGTKVIDVANKINSIFKFKCKVLKSRKKLSAKNFFSKANLSQNSKHLKWKSKVSLQKGLNLIYKKNKK